VQIESWLPDVVVMDFLLPGGIDDLNATEQTRQVCPQTKVVVLTAHTDEARDGRAMIFAKQITVPTARLAPTNELP